MGTGDTMRAGIITRRTLVLPVKICCRSVCNHPCLAALVCFLAVLYRSFPLLFSLLLSASPVLVCTAVLLGTLLSFGELNIPEIEVEREGEELVEEEEKEEEEEEVSHVISSLRVAQAIDATVVTQRERGFSLEKLVEKRRDISERAVEEGNLTEDEVNKAGQYDNLTDYMPLFDETSLGDQHEEGVIEESEKRVDYNILKRKKEVQGERVGEEEEEEEEEEEFGHFQVSRSNGDSPGELNEIQKDGHLDFPLDQKQVRNDNHEEGEEQDEDASDSESDRAESSSPDASMADIIPMLDELHPLLDEETPQLADKSVEGSDAGSETSSRSKESSIESDDDTEDQAEEEEDGIDDNDHGEEVLEGKEDESKSAIKWTEDDQKNLMDLGSLELERNQRLESLIARRRARRNMRLMAEKNLIDLDGADLPLNIPPISTTRQNPFDLPYDPFDDIPGSAPSILLPRKNPFDLPYEPNEEKPDLKGDSFQQEFSVPSQREAVFRRHESFSVGPSGLGFPRHERQELRWKPYFVPERFSGEGTSVSTFQRQLSEASESKLSSVQDTESASSVVEEEEIEEEEEKRLNEEVVSLEREMVQVKDHASLHVERGSLTSEDADPMDVEEAMHGNIQHNEDDEVSTSLGDVEHHHETDCTLLASGEVTPVELDASEILLRMGPGEEEYSSESIISSLSDTDENISSVNQGLAVLQEGTNQVNESYTSGQSIVDSKLNVVVDPKADSGISNQSSIESQPHYQSGVAEDNQHRGPILETISENTGESNESGQSATKSEGGYISCSGSPKQQSLEAEPQYLCEAESDHHHEKHVGNSGINHNDQSGTSGQTSLDSDFNVTGAVMDDSHHRDPVYDLSPASSGKFLSFRSVSSDTLGEILEMSSPPALAELPGIKSEKQPDNGDKDYSGYKEIDEGNLLKEVKARSPEAAEISENDGLKGGEEGIDIYYDSQSGSAKAEPEAHHASVSLHSLATDQGLLQEGGTCKEERSVPERDQIQLSDRSLVEILDSSSTNLLPRVVSLPTPEENLEQKTTQSSDLELNTHIDSFRTKDIISTASISEHMHPNGTSLFSKDDGWPAKSAKIANQDNSSAEAMQVGENSSSTEAAPEFENNHAHFSTSNARTGIVHPDVYKEVVYATEESSNHLDKQLSWLDKSMVESSSDMHDTSLEPSSSQAVAVDEVNINEKTSILEAYDCEDTISIAPVTSDFPGQAPDGVECTSSSLREDMEESTLDKIVYETNSHTLEHSNHSSESYESFSAEEDEIKEIDEKFLSELDTVGDFRVKEVVGEPTHDEKIVERSVISQPEVDCLPKDLSQVQNEPEIPVLEARSVEDLELAFKQLHEGADVEELILPSMTENTPVPDDSRDLREPISDFPTIEARSLEDIQTAMKQISEGDVKEQPEILHSTEGVVKVNEESLVEEHQVREVSTVADTNKALKQSIEETGVQEAVPSTIKNQMVVGESKDAVRTSSDIPVAEADLKTATESNIVDQPRSSEAKDEQPEVMEAISAQEIQPRDAEANEVDIVRDKERSILEVREVDHPNGVGLINEQPVILDAIGFQEVKQEAEVTAINSNEEENSHGLCSNSSSSSSSSDSTN